MRERSSSGQRFESDTDVSVSVSSLFLRLSSYPEPWLTFVSFTKPWWQACLFLNLFSAHVAIIVCTKLSPAEFTVSNSGPLRCPKEGLSRWSVDKLPEDHSGWDQRHLRSHELTQLVVKEMHSARVQQGLSHLYYYLMKWSWAVLLKLDANAHNSQLLASEACV